MLELPSPIPFKRARALPQSHLGDRQGDLRLGSESRRLRQSRGEGLRAVVGERLCHIDIGAYFGAQYRVSGLGEEGEERVDTWLLLASPNSRDVCFFCQFSRLFAPDIARVDTSCFIECVRGQNTAGNPPVTTMPASAKSAGALGRCKGL